MISRPISLSELRRSFLERLLSHVCQKTATRVGCHVGASFHWCPGGMLETANLMAAMYVQLTGVCMSATAATSPGKQDELLLRD